MPIQCVNIVFTHEGVFEIEGFLNEKGWKANPGHFHHKSRDGKGEKNGHVEEMVLKFYYNNKLMRGNLFADI